jgi:hypothetical protein
MRKPGERPLPAHVLDDPRMAEACRARDFGTVFLAARRAGLYPSRIARLCDLTASRVSEVIAGKRAITQITVIERIADGLGIPGHMLGLAPRAWEMPVSGRAVGQMVIAAPVPTAGEGDEVLALQRELQAASSADRQVAFLFSAQVETMRQLDRRLGAETLLPQLDAQIAQMEKLLKFGTVPAAREALAAVLTEAATLAGWQALDLGRYQHSWDLHETAKAAARESGVPALVAHAMAQQAYVLLDLGRSAEAVAQVRYAREQAGRSLPPLMESWLFAAEAEALAAAQNDAACRRQMDRAEAVRPNDPADPALPFLFLADAHLDRWRGNCLATLGADEALEGLTTALSSMDLNGFTRAEAGTRCDLAVVLARRGERDEARQQALRAQELGARTA